MCESLFMMTNSAMNGWMDVWRHKAESIVFPWSITAKGYSLRMIHMVICIKDTLGSLEKKVGFRRSQC